MEDRSSSGWCNLDRMILCTVPFDKCYACLMQNFNVHRQVRMRQIASIIVSPCVGTVVHTSLRHQDWFDENVDENDKRNPGA